MQVGHVRVEGIAIDQVCAPCLPDALVIAEGHHLVARGVEEMVCMRIGSAGLPVAVGQVEDPAVMYVRECFAYVLL